MRKVLLPVLLFIPLSAHAHEPHVCADDLPDAAVLSGHLEHADIVAGAVEFPELFEAGKELFVAQFNLCDGQGRPAVATAAPNSGASGM